MMLKIVLWPPHTHRHTCTCIHMNTYTKTGFCVSVKMLRMCEAGRGSWGVLPSATFHAQLLSLNPFGSFLHLCLHPVSLKLLMPLKCLLFDIPETLFLFFPLYLCPYLWAIFACFPKLNSDVTFSDGLSECPQTFPPPLVLYGIGR